MATRADSVATLFVGVGRSGKSYSQVCDIVYDLLPNRSGPIWTNLPLNVEKIAAFVARRTGKPAAEYAARLHVIPAETMNAWKLMRSGPWEFFAGKTSEIQIGEGVSGGYEQSINDIVNGFIIIDEAHHYWPEEAPAFWHNKWGEWLGELGHPHCQIRFLTQSLDKLADKCKSQCGMRYLIVNSETERDPFFKILLKDWYELFASFTRMILYPIGHPGVWLASCWVREDRKEFDKNVAKDWTKHRFDTEIFKLYESFSKPIAGGQSAQGQYEREYQKRFFPSILLWFFLNNFDRMILPGAKVGIVAWLIFGGVGTIQQWAGGILLKSAQLEPGKKKAGADAGKPNALDVEYPGLSSKSSSQAVTQNPKLKIETTGSGPSLIPDLAFQEQFALERLKATRNERIRQSIQAEWDRLRAEVERGQDVVMLTPKSVTFLDGSECKLGEFVATGKYAGHKLLSIDWDNRMAVLDDDIRLRYGWVSKSVVQGTAESEATIRRVVREVESGSEDGQADRAGGTGHDQRQRDASRPVGPVPGTQVQRLNRSVGGRAVGRKDGDSRSGGPDSGVGAVDGRP